MPSVSGKLPVRSRFHPTSLSNFPKGQLADCHRDTAQSLRVSPIACWLFFFFFFCFSITCHNCSSLSHRVLLGENFSDQWRFPTHPAMSPSASVWHVGVFARSTYRFDSCRISKEGIGKFKVWILVHLTKYRDFSWRNQTSASIVLRNRSLDY